jgi:hypothetical protein
VLVSLCIAAGLDEARRQIEEQFREDDALALLIREIKVSVADMESYFRPVGSQKRSGIARPASGRRHPRA